MTTGWQAAHPLERPALAAQRLALLHGDAAGARAVLGQALALEANLPRVHAALAGMRWPGPGYRHWLAWLHGHLRPRVYLEIGVERGESLALARPPTRAIGVDPAMTGDPLARCAAPTELHAMPSATFLRAPPPGSALHAGGFDLAFVDGDHRFEGVLDDFIGLEAWAAPGALVVLHDTLPLTAMTSDRERRSGFYTGDVWKLVPCLRALRPELHIVTLPVAPTGLTLVAGLQRASRVLGDRRDDIVAAYAGVDSARVVDRPEAVLGPLGRNDPGAVTRWLRDAGVRSCS